MTDYPRYDSGFVCLELGHEGCERYEASPGEWWRVHHPAITAPKVAARVSPEILADIADREASIKAMADAMITDGFRRSQFLTQTDGA